MSFVAVAIGGAALVGAGTTLYTNSQSNKANKRASGIADSELRLSRDQFDYQRRLADQERAYTDQIRTQTNPLRQGVLRDLGDFLGVRRPLWTYDQTGDGVVDLSGPEFTPTAGELPPGLVPAYEPFAADFAPVRDTLEAQYKVARGNLLNQAPVRGGTLGTVMADLEQKRAHDIGAAVRDEQLLSRQERDKYLYGVDAPARAALFGRATEIATGQPTQQFAGLQGAAGISAQGAPTLGQAGQLAATLAEQRSRAATASGQGLGSSAALLAYLQKQNKGKGGEGGDYGGLFTGVMPTEGGLTSQGSYPLYGSPT